MNLRGLINQVTATRGGAGRAPGGAPLGGQGGGMGGGARAGGGMESTGARIGGMVGVLCAAAVFDAIGPYPLYGALAGLFIFTAALWVRQAPALVPSRGAS